MREIRGLSQYIFCNLSFYCSYDWIRTLALRQLCQNHNAARWVSINSSFKNIITLILPSLNL